MPSAPKAVAGAAKPVLSAPCVAPAVPAGCPTAGVDWLSGLPMAGVALCMEKLKPLFPAVLLAAGLAAKLKEPGVWVPAPDTGLSLPVDPPPNAPRLNLAGAWVAGAGGDVKRVRAAEGREAVVVEAGWGREMVAWGAVAA